MGIVVASPTDDGPSRIQVLYDHNGPFELWAEVETNGTITTVMTDPTVWNAFTVGFSNGVIKMYNVTDDILLHTVIPDDPDRNPRNILMDWTIGLAVVAAIVLIVWSFWKRR